MISNSKILITGGLGFIGLHLAKALLNKGNTLFLLDTQEIERSSFLEMGFQVGKELQHLQLDILKDLNSLSNEFDYIIHTAGILGINKVSEKPLLTCNVNVFGTRNVLELAVRQKNLKRFLHFSTSEIYGIHAESSKESDPAVIPNEGTRWVYASSKSFSEYLLKAFIHEHSIPGVIIRPFNVYGLYRKGSNAMTTLIKQALSGEGISLSGNGLQSRSWCYIEDFVQGTLQILASNNFVGEAFNLGNDKEPISMLDLAALICELAHSSSEIRVLNNDRDDVLDRSPNIEKAKQLLNYCPRISLEEGIKEVINWLSFGKTYASTHEC